MEPSPTRAATPRMVVPDVARGLALLGIAMANVSSAWLSGGEGPDSFFGGIRDGSTLDKAATVFAALFVHSRGLPMFSTLLGFGVGLIALSLWRRGFPLAAARGVIVKRYGFLALFGAVHALVLFYGDIMLFYGLAGIVLALMLSLRDKILMRIAYVLIGLTLLGGTLMGVLGYFMPEMTYEMTLGPDTSPGIDFDTYPKLLLFHLTALVIQLLNFPVAMVNYFPLMLIGFVWARRGTLAEPGKHRRELLTWVGIGAAAALCIGLPWGLGGIGVLSPEVAGAFMMLNFAFGILTGPAILAGLALALQPVQAAVTGGARLPMWLWPFAALGKRSMSGYLFQSLLFFLVVYPFTLGFGEQLGAAGKAGLAAAIWAVTLLGACALEALGKPGPFEWAHRRISYGKQGRPQLPAGHRQARPEATNAESPRPTGGQGAEG